VRPASPSSIWRFLPVLSTTFFAYGVKRVLLLPGFLVSAARDCFLFLHERLHVFYLHSLDPYTPLVSPHRANFSTCYSGKNPLSATLSSHSWIPFYPSLGSPFSWRPLMISLQNNPPLVFSFVPWSPFLFPHFLPLRTFSEIVVLASGPRQSLKVLPPWIRISPNPLCSISFPYLPVVVPPLSLIIPLSIPLDCLTRDHSMPSYPGSCAFQHVQRWQCNQISQFFVLRFLHRPLQVHRPVRPPQVR